MFSSYKSQEKARQEKKGGAASTLGRRPAAPAQTAAAPAPSTNGVAGSIVAIKSLVEQLGVDQVKQIAEIFRK